MLHLLKLLAIVAGSLLAGLRAAEEAFAVWVRRTTRPRDLSGVSWA